MNPQRILIRLPNWLGDIVMAASAIEVLHREGFKLHLLIRPPWDGLFRRDPRVAEVIPCRDRGPAFFSMASHLRRRRFTAVVDFTHSLRSQLLWLVAGLKIVYRESRIPDDEFRARHQIHRYLSTLRPLVKSLPDLPPPPHLALPNRAVSGYRSIGVSEKLPLSPIPRYSDTPILLFPAAAFGPAKIWSVDHYRRLIQSLLDRNWPVRLLGSKPDRPFLEAIADSPPLPVGSSKSLTIDTGLDLTELMRVIAESHAVISCDSGPAHLAAALGKPVLVLFFSTDPLRTIPFGPFVRPVVAEVPCRPCFLRKCPIGYLCRDAITPALVLAALDDLLDAPA